MALADNKAPRQPPRPPSLWAGVDLLLRNTTLACTELTSQLGLSKKDGEGLTIERPMPL